jgi:ABC-2 type transport system ATP-binding protein
MALASLENLSLAYGRRTALHQISLQLEPGSIGLLGPNGAGKSSLLKVLMGLIPPTSGDGSLLGRSLRGAGFDRRRLIGYMPEADALVPGLRGAEYVALAGELCGMPKRDAARRAHDLLNYLGLDDARYRRLEEYSTGMKQRIKLAQALVHDPPLLLLDEPTSGLDPEGREAMLQLLGALARSQGKSFILSTHVLGDVERTCETTVILHQGRVLCQDRTDALCRRRDHSYRLKVEGQSQGFAALLREQGVQADIGSQMELALVLPPALPTHQLFAWAAQTDCLITELRPDDDDLERVFHKLLEDDRPRTGTPPQAPTPAAGDGVAAREESPTSPPYTGESQGEWPEAARVA